MDGVRLTEIVEKMNLKNLTPGCQQTGFATDGLF